MALHGLVVLGLLQINTIPEASDATSPSILQVDLVYLREDATGDGGRVPQAQAVGPEAVLEERPATSTEPVLPSEPVPLRAPAAVAIEPATAVPAADLRPADAAGAPKFEPIALPPPAQAADEREERSAPLPVETSAPLQLPTVASSDVPAHALPPGIDQAAEVEPALAKLADGERRMLDRKLAQWSAKLDELAESDVTWEHAGQSYSATFTRVPDETGMGIEHVVVAVTTEQDGNRWATSMRMKRMAFSSFAQFVDRWDPEVQIHDDQIDGRFHSNSEIVIANSDGVQPSFLGKVTTARSIRTASSPRPVRRSEVFLGGLETRVRRIALPRQLLPIPPDKRVSPEQMQRFEHDTRIVFNSDGSFDWGPIDAAEPARRVALPDTSYYLLGGDNVSLYLSGTVSGKVLAYSPADIVIEDDLVYATDPAANPDSGDFIGLVAGRNVAIADPETTGPGDLTVQAAIYANRRFQVRRYGRNEQATLRIYGSVAAGSVSATEPRYRTKIEFDPRLDKARPPGFPMTDRYELDSWDGLWAADLDGAKEEGSTYPLD